MPENLYCPDMKDNRKYRDNWERTFRGEKDREDETIQKWTPDGWGDNDIWWPPGEDF